MIASEYDRVTRCGLSRIRGDHTFIRGAAGPLDYDPGHMRNTQKDAFKPMGALPMTQGTRMHQAAMYLVYDSPYAKMGGNVSDYLREPAFTTMLGSISTLWDDTRVLDGRIGDYIVTMHRATDGSFWVGAMTDWTPRDLQIPPTFLPAGLFTAEILAGRSERGKVRLRLAARVATGQRDTPSDDSHGAGRWVRGKAQSGVTVVSGEPLGCGAWRSRLDVHALGFRRPLSVDENGDVIPPVNQTEAVMSDQGGHRGLDRRRPRHFLVQLQNEGLNLRPSGLLLLHEFHLRALDIADDVY